MVVVIPVFVANVTDRWVGCAAYESIGELEPQPKFELKLRLSLAIRSHTSLASTSETGAIVEI